MAEPDQDETILRPRGKRTDAVEDIEVDDGDTIVRVPTVPAPGVSDGGEVDDGDTIVRVPTVPAPGASGGGEADDGDTIVRVSTVPAPGGGDDDDEDDDDDDEDPPDPREALRFRISNGSAELVLDDDVHIGRNPRPPRLDRGRPVRLLRVESPSGVVSSSHLGLRRTGSTAVAADLMSTNGTVVFLPGFPPRRLRQGESVVAPPGTRLEIGEGIVIEVIRPSALG